MARKENSKDIILSSAVQLASIHGLNGLSIGALAEAVKMTKGGISAHFKSKGDLQLAVIERAALTFYEAVVLPALGHPKGVARLHALGEAWFRYIEAGTFAGGCFFTNALLEVDDAGDALVAREVAQQYNRYIEFIKRCAQEAQAAGELRADISVEVFALELHGIALGALVWRGVRGDQEPFKTGRQALRALIERSRS